MNFTSSSLAYKYGKTLVPYSKIDEQSLKMQTEKCMRVLGFTDRSKVFIISL